MPMPIDPSFALSGAEWQVPGLGQEGAVGGANDAATKGGGFGGMLSSSIASLGKAQDEAAGASQAFAAGTVTDPTQVVMAVERARLSMQMASQVRTKAVEAMSDVLHTQV